MNIHSGLPPVPSLSPENPVARPSAGQASPAATVTDGDQTHISQAASLAAASSSVSDVRLDKVTAVQQALANGSYNVSALDVASSLIDHMLQR